MPSIATQVREGFLGTGSKGMSTTDLYHKIKASGRRTSYQATYRVVYCLRQLGLVEFVSHQPARYPNSYPKSLYRIASGKQDDELWNTYPPIVLYPSTRLGGSRYIPGTSTGRAKKYAKTEPTS